MDFEPANDTSPVETHAELVRLEVALLRQLAEEIGALRGAVVDLERRFEMRSQDLLLSQFSAEFSDSGPVFQLETEKPVAVESVDHRFPKGTAKNSPRWPRFVFACERLFGPKLSFLDLGCAGGGLVLDFVLRGHDALGLEGSDYSLLRQRAEWRTLPHRLMTCDIAVPFSVRRTNGEAMRFDVISAWDVLEHISETALPVMLENVRKHLSPRGIFTGTVSTRLAGSAPDGTNYHATVQPKAWWEAAFAKAGFAPRQPEPFLFEDYPRGNGNNFPANFRENPETGFHFALSRKD
jgi:SAM-dependent methyltransferase